MCGGIFGLWLCVKRGWGRGGEGIHIVRGGGVCFHFLSRVTLVVYPMGWDFA